MIWNEVTGNIVGGHQRYKVLLAEGVTEIDCVVVHIEDPLDEKAVSYTHLDVYQRQLTGHLNGYAAFKSEAGMQAHREKYARLRRERQAAKEGTEP